MQSFGESPGKLTVTIVLAEDEADMRAMLAECLRREGHVVWEAADGGEAVVLVRAHAPALLLLDIWMPVLNGLEVLEHLGREREAVGMKVVVLSQLGDSDTRLEGYALGVDDYWTKDFSLVELCADPTPAGLRVDPAGAPGMKPTARVEDISTPRAVRPISTASGAPGLESNASAPTCPPTIKNASNTSIAASITSGSGCPASRPSSSSGGCGGCCGGWATRTSGCRSPISPGPRGRDQPPR